MPDSIFDRLKKQSEVNKVKPFVTSTPLEKKLTESGGKYVPKPKGNPVSAGVKAPTQTVAGLPVGAFPVGVVAPGTHAKAYAAIAPTLKTKEDQDLLNSALYIVQKFPDGRRISPIDNPLVNKNLKISDEDLQEIKKQFATSEGRKQIQARVAEFKNLRLQQQLDNPRTIRRALDGYRPGGERPPGQTSDLQTPAPQHGIAQDLSWLIGGGQTRDPIKEAFQAKQGYEQSDSGLMRANIEQGKKGIRDLTQTNPGQIGSKIIDVMSAADPFTIAPRLISQIPGLGALKNAQKFSDDLVKSMTKSAIADAVATPAVVEAAARDILNPKASPQQKGMAGVDLASNALLIPGVGEGLGALAGKAAKAGLSRFVKPAAEAVETVLPKVESVLPKVAEETANPLALSGSRAVRPPAVNALPEKIVPEAVEATKIPQVPKLKTEPATVPEPPVATPKAKTAIPKGSTKIIHEETAQVRDWLGMEEYQKDSQKLNEILSQAHKEGLVKDARSIADSVTANPRPVSTKEQVALAARAHQLRSEINASYAKLGKTTDPEAAAAIQQNLDALKAEAGTIIQASDIAGSETGRALGSRRKLFDDVNAANIRGKIKEAAGGVLPHELEAKVADLEKRLAQADNQAADSRVSQATKADAEAALKSALRAKGSRNKVFTREAYDEAVARRSKGAARPTSKQRGSVSLITGQDFADAVTVAGYTIESGIRDFDLIYKGLKEHFPGITKEDAARAVHEVYNVKKGGPVSAEAKAAAESKSKLLRDTKAILTEAQAQSEGLPAYIEHRINLGERGYSQLYQSAKGAGFDIDEKGFAQAVVDALNSRGHAFESAAQKVARQSSYRVQKDALQIIESTKKQAAWNAANRYQKVGKVLLNLPGAAKNLAASVDLSAPGRQGILLSIAHPQRAANAFKSMVKSIGEKGFDAVISDVHASPYYGQGRAAGLGVVDDSGHMIVDENFAHLAFSDQFRKGPFAKMISFPLDASERTYAAFLSQLRQDSFDAIAQGYKNLSAEDAKQIARYVNSMTGLAKGYSAKTEAGLGFLNNFLFSSRFLLSRAEVASGATLSRAIAKGGAGSPLAKAALADHAKILSAYGTVLGLGALGAGYKVSLDKDDPNFAQIQAGNQRIDVSGGIAPVLRALIKVGDAAVGAAPGQQSRVSSYDAPGEIGRFFINRTAPLVRAGLNSLTRDNFGEETDALREGAKLFQPIGLQQVVKSVNEGRPPGQIAGSALLEGLGLSTNYTDPKKKPTKAKKAPPKYKPIKF